MSLTKAQARNMIISSCKTQDNRYVGHCLYVGELAGYIARDLGLDGDYASVLGYLHDIGRSIDHANHIYAGYNYLCQIGYEEYAFITLTHSFLNNDMACICAQLLPEDSEGYDVVKNVVESHKNTDYDRIIQVCDLLCLHNGCTTIEQRLDDIESRRGTHSKSAYHRATALAQKAGLEQRLGHSIYDYYDSIDIDFVVYQP